MPLDRAEPLLKTLADLTGDDEPKGRVRCVARTHKAATDGKAATGWPKLAELLGGVGAEAVKVVEVWLGRVASNPVPLPKPPSRAPAGLSAWGAPTPLRECPEVPAFPVEHLSPRMCNWVAAQAAELQVPVALPTLLALAVAAGASPATSP